MNQFKTDESQSNSQNETAKSATVSCRISTDWDEQLDSIALKSGKKKAELIRDSIARYLGREDVPRVMSEILELKQMISYTKKQNDRLLEQNKNLHQRLRTVEGKFKQLAG